MERIRFVVVGHSIDYRFYNWAKSLSAIQAEFDFSVHEKAESLPTEIDTNYPVSAEILEQLGESIIANNYPGEYPIVLCDYMLENDLFSTHDDKVAVITTHGWIGEFSPYPVQRYIFHTLAGILMDLYISTPVHDKTAGCVGDYCDNKKDINIGLANCNYCPECQAMIIRGCAKGDISLRQVAAIYKILDLAAERKTCFVLMPFDSKFKDVYTVGIEPTMVMRKWVCTRADMIFQTREITTLIWEQILRADLIIADLTRKNPNVFYELGYAHALDKNTILITQSIKTVPFDLRHIQIIEYSASPDGYQNLATSLAQYL